MKKKREEILRNFSNDGRNNEILNQFKKELRKEYNLQIIQSSIDEIKKIAKDFTTADSTFFAKTERLNNPLFSFSTIVYTQKQFIDFLKKHKGSNLDIDKSLNLYIDNRLLEHEDTQLESKYPEFRMLVQEYYDGMLMFEVSSKEVWEKAAEDTQGLKAFFEANKQNYTWDTPRFKGTLVFCKDKKAEKKALKIMKTSPADSIPIYLNKALNTDKEKIVKIEKGLFMMGENQAIDKYVFGTGNYIPPTEYPIVISNGKIMEKGPDQYVDMKGIVISDYQNYLQDEWIKMLRKKYPVVIFQDVLQTVEVKE